METESSHSGEKIWKKIEKVVGHIIIKKRNKKLRKYKVSDSFILDRERPKGQVSYFHFQSSVSFSFSFWI